LDKEEQQIGEEEELQSRRREEQGATRRSIRDWGPLVCSCREYTAWWRWRRRRQGWGRVGVARQEEGCHDGRRRRAMT
jgi:hypothetical protein